MFPRHPRGPAGTVLPPEDTKGVGRCESRERPSTPGQRSADACPAHLHRENLNNKHVVENEESINIIENQQEGERERTQKKTIIQRIYDGVFGEDEFKEEREDMRNQRQQIEEDETIVDARNEPREPRDHEQSEQSNESNDNIPVNIKTLVNLHRNHQVHAEVQTEVYYCPSKKKH